MASKTRARGAAASRARARTPVRQHLRPWARDATGIGLVVLALLTVLGLWFDAAGPVGTALEWVLHATIGSAAIVFPVLALYWGALLLRAGTSDDRVRMLIGFVLAFLGVLALMSLASGNPRPFAGYERLRDAAGVIGAFAAWPLGKLVSKVGVSIVWLGGIVLGLVIFTGTPLAAVWNRVREAFSFERDEDEEAEPVPETAKRRDGPVINTEVPKELVEILQAIVILFAITLHVALERRARRRA